VVAQGGVARRVGLYGVCGFRLDFHLEFGISGQLGRGYRDAWWQTNLRDEPRKDAGNAGERHGFDGGD